jgi:hypothetical protein
MGIISEPNRDSPFLNTLSHLVLKKDRFTLGSIVNIKLARVKSFDLSVTLGYLDIHKYKINRTHYKYCGRVLSQ